MGKNPSFWKNKQAKRDEGMIDRQRKYSKIEYAGGNGEGKEVKE